MSLLHNKFASFSENCLFSFTRKALCMHYIHHIITKFHIPLIFLYKRVAVSNVFFSCARCTHYSVHDITIFHEISLYNEVAESQLFIRVSNSVILRTLKSGYIANFFFTPPNSITPPPPHHTHTPTKKNLCEYEMPSLIITTFPRIMHVIFRIVHVWNYI